MPALVQNGIPIFTDVDGDPLEDGYIYIGEAGLNPLSNPLQAYWDAELTIPATNIRTKGGAPSNNGTPSRLYVATNYSILVRDKKSKTVYSILNSVDYYNSPSGDLISQTDTIATLREIVPVDNGFNVQVKGYYSVGDIYDIPVYYWDQSSTAVDNGGSVIKPNGIDAIDPGRWVWSNDVETVNIMWFGAYSDGVGDSSVQIQNAIDIIKPLVIPNGIFKILSGLTATHELEINCFGKLKYEGATPNTIVLDVTTSTDDLDFSKSPVLNNLVIEGNSNAESGIRMNSVYAPRIINYIARGFTDGWALTFRTIALTAGARWNEGYYVENINSNFNKGGIRFYVDGGTTSHGYGYVSGNITNAVGTSGNRSTGILVETTQLYNTILDVNLWCNGYGTAIQVGSASYPNARIYWCNFRITGEEFNTDNNSIDLTYGEIFGCKGNALLNMGTVVNPSNNRLEIYGQYQYTNYGTTTKQIAGIDTKLTPLMGAFLTDDAFTGQPEGGFGIATGSNFTSPIVWMRNFVGNRFRICGANFDSEPDTDDSLFDVDHLGNATAKTKMKTPFFSSEDQTFTATGSTTTTQAYFIRSTLDTKGTYLVTCHGTGANTSLSASGIVTFADNSQDIISPVIELIQQDFNFGSIALQTIGNIAANTFSAGNGGGFQVVVTNDNVADMTMTVTITRIG